MLRFTAQGYCNSSLEHLNLAREMINSKNISTHHYFIVHYFSGLAVEEILRALSVEDGNPFDGQHDIGHWAPRSGLFPNGANARDTIRRDMNEINTLWRANQRYMTYNMLDSYLSEPARIPRIKGDKVKYSSKRLFNLANRIVGIGCERFENRNRG